MGKYQVSKFRGPWPPCPSSNAHECKATDSQLLVRLLLVTVVSVFFFSNKFQQKMLFLFVFLLNICNRGL